MNQKILGALSFCLVIAAQLSAFSKSVTNYEGRFYRVICNSKGACHAIGFYYIGASSQSPMLALSVDNGKTWTYPINSCSNLKFAFFSDIHCNDEGNLCIVVGTDWNSVLGTEVPMIARSTDGGFTWTYSIESASKLPVNFLSYGNFSSVSCNSAGTTCVAGGSYYQNKIIGFSTPLLALSVDSGKTWTYSIESGSNLPADFLTTGAFYTTSCNRKGNICVAAGKSYLKLKDGDFPLLAVTHDAGNTWTYPLTNSPVDYSKNLEFRNLTCNGNGDTCIAVGSYWTHKEIVPAIAITTDGGSTWSYPTDFPSNLPEDFLPDPYWGPSKFKSVSCNSEGDVCMAAGSYQKRDGNHFDIPMIALSTDYGSTWTYPVKSGSNLPALAAHGSFNDVSCNSAGDICSAVGSYFDLGTGSSAPMVALSKDAGKTWTYPITSAQFPADYDSLGGGNGNISFFGVNCNSTGDVCSAVGSYAISHTLGGGTLGIPMLALTTDGGSTWTYPIESKSNLP